MNSLFTLGTMVGHSVPQMTEGTIVGQLGMTDVRFPNPVFHGDTQYTETEVTEVRMSTSRPGQGVVSMKHTGRNQDGLVVAEATRTCLMWTREAHEASTTGAKASMTVFQVGPTILSCPDRADR